MKPMKSKAPFFRYYVNLRIFSGGSQPRKEEGASHHARRGKNAEAFLNLHRAILLILIMRYARKVKAEKILITKDLRQ